jgi:hypothetical protein
MVANSVFREIKAVNISENLLNQFFCFFAQAVASVMKNKRMV